MTDLIWWLDFLIIYIKINNFSIFDTNLTAFEHFNILFIQKCSEKNVGYNMVAKELKITMKN